MCALRGEQDLATDACVAIREVDHTPREKTVGNGVLSHVLKRLRLWGISYLVLYIHTYSIALAVHYSGRLMISGNLNVVQRSRPNDDTNARGSSAVQAQAIWKERAVLGVVDLFALPCLSTSLPSTELLKHVLCGGWSKRMESWGKVAQHQSVLVICMLLVEPPSYKRFRETHAHTHTHTHWQVHNFAEAVGRRSNTVVFLVWCSITSFFSPYISAPVVCIWVGFCCGNILRLLTHFKSLTVLLTVLLALNSDCKQHI